MTVTNSLAERRPEVLVFWDYEANGDLTPHDVSTADSRVVAWRCTAGPDHTWQRKVTEMRSTKCAFCINKWVSITNCLATIEPDLAAEWHPTLNGDITPYDVMPGTGKQAWWLCPDGHAWLCTPNRRTNPSHRSTCSECAHLRGRPQSGRARAVADLYPKTAALWHPIRNGPLTPDEVKKADRSEAWWLCPESPHHEWQARICDMASLKVPPCPFCTNKRVCVDNNLAYLHPEIAAQWHPTLNGDLTPDQVTLLDSPPVWWKCDKGPDHEWPAKVYQRAVLGKNCRACAGRQLSVTNRLDILFPDVAAELDTVRNGITPAKVVFGAVARYWWTCRHCSHHWETRVEKRTRYGQGCPDCAFYNVSKEELFLAHEINMFTPVSFETARVRDTTGKVWRVDIVLPDAKIVIEYDGSYWHADRQERDVDKTQALTRAGWSVLRVREAPLGHLAGVWCTTSRPERYKATADSVLEELAAVGAVGGQAVRSYAAEPGLIARAEALLAIEARAERRKEQQRKAAVRDARREARDARKAA